MVSGRGVSLTLRSRVLMYPGGSALALRGVGFGLTRPRSLGPASSSPGTGPEAAAGGGTTEWSRRSWKCPSLLPCASRAHQTLLFFRTSSVKDSSFVEKMKKTGRNIVVFYGSQTGTAEEFANRLSKDAHRYGMRGMAADPEEYDLGDLSSLSEIENALAVFCMATYGEGDPTDNAQDFYDWLQETDVDLSGVKYAVFGLGNKTYEHFNAMGKYVDKRLEQLGAQRIFDLGLGDDDGNLEEDFITWREQFWPAVCEHLGVEATGDESR
ncbi:hypothetical protein E2I00_008433 [Balaenoptera physalus]|uniref:Flavodoxin-like domain-containing protein n=1 Tax=Balaenoptera physalus TaxID=9770 RepID=A0A6A1QC92_BALPH|nr:hypothetical protein E2I00_008433 [Balaenoptera physalus]